MNDLDKYPIGFSGSSPVLEVRCPDSSGTGICIVDIPAFGGKCMRFRGGIRRSCYVVNVSLLSWEDLPMAVFALAKRFGKRIRDTNEVCYESTVNI